MTSPCSNDRLVALVGSLNGQCAMTGEIPRDIHRIVAVSCLSLVRERCLLSTGSQTLGSVRDRYPRRDGYPCHLG